MIRSPLLACLAVGLAGMAEPQQARPPAGPPPASLMSQRSLSFADIDLRNLRDWLAAARAHQPGQADAPATAIAGWPAIALAYTVTDVVSLLRIRALLSAVGAPGAQKYRGQNFCVFCMPASTDVIDINALLGLSLDGTAGSANLILERGALLLTDIATLVPAPSAQGPGRSGQQTSLHLSDGEVLSTEHRVDHWSYARFLLDGVAPSPSQEAFVLSWYRATSAHQASQFRWSDAVPNLARAQELFPEDRRVLFLAGVMHETFATSAVQGGAQDLVRAGLFVGVVTGQKELALAEAALRQALGGDPAAAEVRLHLGRVAGRLGRHDEAVRELATAQTALTDPQLAYYAALFLGTEQDLTGNRDAARVNFDRAEALFPGAQSALLAQSRLARRNGDSPGARRSLERLFAQPADGSRPPDPWLAYQRSPVRDAEALMAEMRKSFVTGGGR